MLTFYQSVSNINVLSTQRTLHTYEINNQQNGIIIQSEIIFKQFKQLYSFHFIQIISIFLQNYFTRYSLLQLKLILFLQISKAKDEQCYKALKNLFTQHNVPQSVQTAINNTGSAFPKSFIERGLARLLDEKYIVFLQIGKSGKLYVRDQSKLKVLSLEETTQLQSEIKTNQETQNQLQQQIIDLQNQIQQLNSIQTEKEIETQIQQQKVKNQQLKEQLKEFEGIELKDKNFYENQLKELKKVYKQRKEFYENLMDLIDKMSEGAEMESKDLALKIGLEEMETVQIPLILKRN